MSKQFYFKQFGRNIVRKKQHKTYQDEDKKSGIYKKINSQIKKPHLKMIPIKDKYQIFFGIILSDSQIYGII